jgi:hypothetical protein
LISSLASEIVPINTFIPMISLISFINGIREKIRLQNYDPIAPSHTGQIQTHKKLRLLY